MDLLSQLEFESEIEFQEFSNLDEPTGLSIFPEDVQIIKIHQKPTQDNWTYEPIYRPTIGNKWTVWQVMFDPSNSNLYMSHGQTNGKKIKQHSPIVENKSGRNLQEQALLEARSRYLKKLDEGYRPYGAPTEVITEVMLARKYDPNKTKFKRWPVAGEAKLDGIRCRSYSSVNHVDGVAMISRRNKEFSWFNELRKEILSFLKYLPIGSHLDGELYSHELTFNQLSSAIKTVKQRHKNNDKVKYFIFDLIEPERLPTEDRYNLLVDAYRRYIEDGNQALTFYLVSITMLFSPQEILEAHDDYVEQGYEGIMIRKFAGTCIDTPITHEYVDPLFGNNIITRICTLGNRTEDSVNEARYKGRRNANLYKYKNFEDEEGKILDVVSGKGTEEDAALFVIEDPRGNIFNVRPRGEIIKRKQWFANKDYFIGKMYTYRFQETSEYGVPRFLTGIGLRDYE